MSVFTGMVGPSRREAEEFAALLDAERTPADHELADLVTLARSLAPADHAPSPDFRAALRERLVAEAATRTPTVPAPRSSPDVVAPRRRWRKAVVAVALTSVVAGGGAVAASTQALPGDMLYGLKRQVEDVQLALAGSDLSRGREHLEQADARLSEVEALASSSSASEAGTRARIGSTLGDMERSTALGTVELTDTYRETGDPEPVLLLDRFVADQRVRLDDLLSVLDPSLRARVQAQLDELARIATETGAVLGSQSVALLGVSVGEVSSTSRDGWAESRRIDYEAASGGDSGTSLAGAGDVPAVAGGTTETSGSLLDAVPGLGGGSSGESSSGGGTKLGGGTKASLPPVGSVTSPLPSVAPTPLPNVAPTPLPTVTPTSATSPLPLPCVPVPPLTSC
jgi:hypothetical protein